MSVLGDSRLIRTIKLRNFLSFGPTMAEFELFSLNVLIGPNASGKSNVIEALDVVRATTQDLTVPIRAGGGVGEWLWKGEGSSSLPTAEIEVTVYNPQGYQPLRHRLVFGMVGQRFELEDEAIENERPDYPDMRDVRFYYRFQHGRPVLSVRRAVESSQTAHDDEYYERKLQREDLAANQSVLSQRKDPDQYPEITYLGQQYAQIKLYREWNLGRYTPPRLPQKPDLPNDFLLEDASNLGLVLNDLQYRTGLQAMLLDKLREFHDGFTNISTRILGGTVQVFLSEKKLNTPIPATRLSDGTLRYLCLLAILCHPEPPPLVAIEEPELGLHPDILPSLAGLMVEASHRTQLVVTTHSEVLIDALSSTPESVIVCEKENGVTTMRRPDPNDLTEWLKEYALGQLWRRGEIGGNRW
jgi:predicted ATPase